MNGDHGDYVARFNAAMDDDFNTPEAVAVLFDLANVLNRAKSGQQLQEAAYFAETLRHLGGILGFLQANPEDVLKRRQPITGRLSAIEADDTLIATGRLGATDEQIDNLIAQRLAARKAKNWAESDRIRDELKAQGVILEDGPQGTTWRRA